MAGPEPLVKRAGAKQMEFLAEETIVSILSKFRHPEFKFIRGSFGPFHPNAKVEVPLWLAIALKKKGLCRIMLPDWLDVDNLELIRQTERSNDANFESLPFHYVEIATLLLQTASDEFRQADRVQSMIEDIENIRMEKIRRGIQGMSDTVLQGHSVMSTKMNNVGAMEISMVREFLTEAMNMFYVLSDQVDQPPRGGPAAARRQSGASSTLPDGTGQTTAGPPKRLRRFREGQQR